MFEFFGRKMDMPNSKLNWISDLTNKKDIKFEVCAFFLIFLAGVLPRLIFVNAYPNLPISDFYNIEDLALSFEKDILAKGNIYWQNFAPGLPIILSVLFKFIPYPPENVARWATAFITGLPPILPFLIWRDIFSRRVRIIAGLLLALWPGQILFSGTVAQDNWIIFPTVGLAVLAVRVLAGQKDGYPLWAGLFYVSTVAIRQEMLIALLPLVAIAILGSRREKWSRNFIAGICLIGILFSMLIIQRGLATGRYALSSKHLGVSILGAYIPGAGIGWVAPWSYLSIYHSEIEVDENFDRRTTELAWQEFLRRPRFHMFRMAGSSMYYLFNVDKEVALMSLTAEGVLAHRYSENAKTLHENLTPLLQFYPQLIHELFLSAVFYSLFKRQYLNWASPILLTIALKIGLHAVIVSQPRYFLIVEALEILVIAMVLDVMLKRENWKSALHSMLISAVATFLLVIFVNNAKLYIEKNDGAFQPGLSNSVSMDIVETLNFKFENPGVIICLTEFTHMQSVSSLEIVYL